jgi:hypothetical protein
MLGGTYSGIYGEIVHRREQCWNKGRLYLKIANLFYFCHLKSWSGRKVLYPTVYFLCGSVERSVMSVYVRDTSSELADRIARGNVGRVAEKELTI